jgi:hypothetical protein
VQITYDEKARSTGIQIRVEHPGFDFIPIRGNLLDRSRIERDGFEDRTYDTFVFINGYYEKKVPLNIQEKIFLKIREIRVLMEEIFDVEDLLQTIKPMVAELVAYHDFEKIRWYLATEANVIIPESVKDAYDGDEQIPGSRAQTYIRNEYMDLITMGTILRCLYPLFIEFIGKNQKTVGTRLKEYYAFMIMEDSYLMQHRAMERLTEYIDGCVNKKTAVDLNNIFNGNGSEDFPRQILATVIVKKVCCGDIRGVGMTSSLVNIIWQCVKGSLSDRNTNYGTNVEGKRLDGVDHPDKVSRAETFKIKGDTAVGDIVLIRNYATRIYQVAQKVKPDVNLDLLDEFRHYTVKSLSGTNIEEGQVVLMQYVLHRAIAPRGVGYLSKLQVIDCIAVAQTILWERGHQHLAALIGATRVEVEGVAHSINANSYKARMEPKLVDDIYELYKFSIPSNGQESGEEISKKKKQHPVINALHAVAGMFIDSQWQISLPAEKIKLITGNELINQITPSSEILNMLARVVIEIIRR